MQDHQSLNDQTQLPTRYSMQTTEEIHTNQLLAYIERTKPANNVQTNSPTTETPIHDPRTQANIAREDEVIYAVDTNVIDEKDAISQISQKLINYSTSTFARNVNINWNKAELIATKKEHVKLIAGLPRPFNKAQMGTTGKALWQEIDINLTRCKAIKARPRKERQSWQIPRGVFLLTWR